MPAPRQESNTPEPLKQRLRHAFIARDQRYNFSLVLPPRTTSSLQLCCSDPISSPPPNGRLPKSLRYKDWLSTSRSNRHRNQHHPHRTPNSMRPAYYQSPLLNLLPLTCKTRCFILCFLNDFSYPHGPFRQFGCRHCATAASHGCCAIPFPVFFRGVEL